MEGNDEKTTFLGRNKVKILCMLLFAIGLMGAAVFSGIGYQATVDMKPIGMTATRGLSENTVSVFNLFKGDLKVYFNPFLYPISYLSGCGLISRSFIRASEFWDYKGAEVADMVLTYTLFLEFAKNLPYFFAIGGLAAVGLAKLRMWTLSRRAQSFKMPGLNRLSPKLSNKDQTKDTS